MEKRYYDANLIWAMAREKCQQEIKTIGHHPTTMTTHDPRIYIYADGIDGALLVQRGKIYHDENPSDEYFANTDDTIGDYDGKLHEVVLKFGQASKSFTSYEAFIEWLKS